MSRGRCGSQAFFKDLPALCILIGTALWLRLHDSCSKYLDIDEAIELFVAGRPSFAEIFRMIRESFPQQYPVNYLLHHLILRFTHDIQAARCFPIILGAASVALSYTLGARLHSRKLGWLWSCLLCFSVYHIQYSQTLRLYSLVLFLFALHLSCSIRALRTGSLPWSYTATAVLFQLAYPFAFAAVAVESAFLWFSQPERRSRTALTALLVLSIPAAWLASLGRTLFLGPMFTYGPKAVFGAPELWSVLFQFGQHDRATALVYAALFLIGFAACWRDRMTRGLTAALGGILLALLLATMLSLWRAHLFLDPRHLIAVHLLYLGFIAAGMLALLSLTPLSRVPTPVALVLATAFIVQRAAGPLADYAAFNRPMQQALLRSAAFLRREIGPRDVIIASNPNFGATFIYYYDPASFFRLKDVSLAWGLNFFVFPKDLKAFSGRYWNAAYTLNPLAPGSATMDREGFSRLLSRTETSGGRLWFVHLPVNYLTGDRPFYSLLRGVPWRLQSAAPGVYSLMGRESLK